MTVRTWIAPAVACLTAATVLAGCSGSGGSGGAGNTFVLAARSDPGNLDPGKQVWTGTSVLHYLYDPLVSIAANGTIASGLASHWTSTPTGAAFTLKPGVRCTDGSTLDAATVAANLNWIANPKNASPLSGVFLPQGSVATASGPSTVTIRLKSAYGTLLQGIAQIPIVCRAGLADRTKLVGGADGTGPYTLASSTPGSSYALTRRTGYTWGAGGAKTLADLPKTVKIVVTPNDSTAANQLLSGQLNAALITGPDAQRVSRQLKPIATVGPPLGLFFNEAKSHVTADPQVRRALARATNIGELSTIAAGSASYQAKSMVGNLGDPNPCSGDPAQSVPSYDPAAAKTALAGKHLNVRLLYTTAFGSPSTAAMERLQEQWQATGVKVTLQGLSVTQLLQQFNQTGNWDVALWEIDVPASAPSQLAGSVSGPSPRKGGNNIGQVDNTAFSRLEAQALPQSVPAGCATYQQAEQALYSRADLLPMWVLPAYFFGSKFTFTATLTDNVVPVSVRAK